MIETMLRWSIRTPRDVVVLRKRLEQASQILGVSALVRTRWATAASDVGRAILESGGGEAAIGMRDTPLMLALDLATSGLVDAKVVEGARRLVGDCELNSDLAGTEIRLRFATPDRVLDAEAIARLRAELSRGAVGDDVTVLHSENRRLETAMAALRVAKEGRERLLSVHRTMLEVLPDIVWRSDDNGRLGFVNRRWSVMTGRRQSRPGSLFDVIAEVDRPSAREAWNDAVESNSPVRFECRLIAREVERWVLVHGRPHRQPESRREWIGAITDIHDTKLREIEQARLVEFRDRMVGVVGHDLRSPLWFIGTASRMLLDQGDDPDRRARYLEQIVENVDRSRRMIDDLLDYTRTQLGAGLLDDVEPVDCMELLQTLAGQARVTHPEREINVVGPESMSVEADADRLMQALGNMLANALSYGLPDTPVTLGARQSGAVVRLSVRNRGEDIPPERLERVFQPFRRARDDDRNARGLGLGLYIVQAIARAHGGRVQLRSQDGWIEACLDLPTSARPIAPTGQPFAEPPITPLPNIE